MTRLPMKCPLCGGERFRTMATDIFMCQKCEAWLSSRRVWKVVSTIMDVTGEQRSESRGHPIFTGEEVADLLAEIDIAAGPVIELARLAQGEFSCSKAEYDDTEEKINSLERLLQANQARAEHGGPPCPKDT